MQLARRCRCKKKKKKWKEKNTVCSAHLYITVIWYNPCYCFFSSYSCHHLPLSLSLSLSLCNVIQWLVFCSGVRMESRVAAERCPESHHSYSTECVSVCVCVCACFKEWEWESEPNQSYIADRPLSVACVSVTLHCLNTHLPSSWAAELPFVSPPHVACACARVAFACVCFAHMPRSTAPHLSWLVNADGPFKCDECEAVIPQMKSILCRLFSSRKWRCVWFTFLLSDIRHHSRIPARVLDTNWSSGRAECTVDQHK